MYIQLVVQLCQARRSGELVYEARVRELRWKKIIDSPFDARLGGDNDSHVARQRDTVKVQHMELSRYFSKIPLDPMDSDRIAPHEIASFLGYPVLSKFTALNFQIPTHHKFTWIAR